MKNPYPNKYSPKGLEMKKSERKPVITATVKTKTNKKKKQKKKKRKKRG